MTAGAEPRPTGVVYIYRRRPEERAGLEVLLMEPLWHVEQHSQLLVEDVRDGDCFGLDVAINGFTALVGAPGDSTIEDSAGSVTAFDVEYQRVKFEKHEFSVTENFHLGRIAVRVRRAATQYRFTGLPAHAPVMRAVLLRRWCVRVTCLGTSISSTQPVT